MVKVKIDMTGWVMSEHGVADSRLTVIRQVEDYINPTTGRHFAQWLCECSCDEHRQIIVTGGNLKGKMAQKSCGCLSRELSSKRMKENAAKYNSKNKRKTNPVNLDGGYGIGWTLNTNAEFYFDLEDYDKIKDYCWNEHIAKNGYRVLEARDRQTGKHVRMHWVIAGKYYDHKNRNTLDNRKENLRQTTQQKNVHNSSIGSNNTSGIIGVCVDSRSGKWVAYIGIDGKHKHCGYFVEKQDAIIARLKAELEYFGKDFAPQRNLFAKYGINTEEE